MKKLLVLLAPVSLSVLLVFVLTHRKSDAVVHPVSGFPVSRQGEEHLAIFDSGAWMVPQPNGDTEVIAANGVRFPATRLSFCARFAGTSGLQSLNLPTSAFPVFVVSAGKWAVVRSLSDGSILWQGEDWRQ